MSSAICYFLCCIASVARSNAKWCLWCQTSGGVGPEEHAFPWFALSHAGAPLLWPGGASVVLQQSCWPAPCGEVGRVGQAARAGSVEKDRAGQDYDATLFLERQHAEPLNMQPFFFCATASTVCPAEPWVRPRVRPGRSGESGSACDTQAILTADLEDQFIIRAIWVPCESVPSVCGWAVQPETPGFLCLLCVKVWFNRASISVGAKMRPGWNQTLLIWWLARQQLLGDLNF